MEVPEHHRRAAPGELGFGVITVSDTRTEAEDTSGRRIAELAVAAGHRLVERYLVPDDPSAIRAAAQALLALADLDVLVLSGGTGYSPRDVTLEAVEPLFDRRVEGFGEIFRMLSFEQVGPAAMLSRATAGLTAGRAIFVLPGSPGAVDLAMSQIVLPEAGHLLGQARREK